MSAYNFTNLGLFFFLVLPSTRAIFKYAPTSPLTLTVLYALMVMLIVYCFHNEVIKINFQKRISYNTYIYLVLIFVVTIIWFVYPIADGLKLQMRGSDQDDCVIIGANLLLSFNHPYTQNSYYGNPCSPGVGMLVLYLPIVFFNLYEFGSVISGAAALIIVQRYTLSIFKTAFFTTLVFIGLFQLEMLVVGSDLFVIGCGLVIVSLELTKAILKRNFFGIIWIALLTGLLSSTRLNFLVLVPIFTIFIFLHWKRAAVYFGIMSLCVAIIPSSYIYFHSPTEFSPLHLLDKSNLLLGGGLKEIAAGFSVVAFFCGAYLVKRSVHNIPFAVFIALAPSLLAVAMGDLIMRHSKFGEWEGANYLLPLIPLVSAILTIRLFRTNHSK
jgi:hypothetical protein